MSRETPDTITPGFLPPPAMGGGPSRPGDTIVPAWQGVTGYGRSISRTMYYEARVGFTRMYEAELSSQKTLASRRSGFDSGAMAQLRCGFKPARCQMRCTASLLIPSCAASLRQDQ